MSANKLQVGMRHRRLRARRSRLHQSWHTPLTWGVPPVTARVAAHALARVVALHPALYHIIKPAAAAGPWRSAAAATLHVVRGHARAAAAPPVPATVQLNTLERTVTQRLRKRLARQRRLNERCWRRGLRVPAHAQERSCVVDMPAHTWHGCTIHISVCLAPDEPRFVCCYYDVRNYMCLRGSTCGRSCCWHKCRRCYYVRWPTARLAHLRIGRGKRALAGSFGGLSLSSRSKP